MNGGVVLNMLRESLPQDRSSWESEVVLLCGKQILLVSQLLQRICEKGSGLKITYFEI